jgi:hypothetical protein
MRDAIFEIQTEYEVLTTANVLCPRVPRPPSISKRPRKTLENAARRIASTFTPFAERLK